MSETTTEKNNEPFLWGVATSAHQVEGGNTQNDWSEWEQQGKVEGGVSCGESCDHWNRYIEDIALIRKLNLNSYRFSVEWSRIEPSEGVFDRVAMTHYASVISECKKQGILPMVTLHHFTHPLWFVEKGGWTQPSSATHFARFTREIATFFKSRNIFIQHWCTFNEPMVLAVGGYLGGFMPPGIFAPHQVGWVNRNILNAHVQAYRILHEVFDSIGDQKIQVGIAHNMQDFRADRRWHLIEQVCRFAADRFFNHAWLDAVTGRRQHFGVKFFLSQPPQLPDAQESATVDFIGVNYYTKSYLMWRPRDAQQYGASQFPMGVSFARRGEQASDMGWAIHPEGFRKVLRKAAQYGVPVIVTENGIADRDDRLRAHFIRVHLEVLKQERERGLDIRGYFHWSLLDNFEWIKGFGPRFGLYEVDYATQKRRIRESARVYAEWVLKS